MIKSVRKRDGRVVDYNISKIESAISQAMLSLGYGEIKDIKRMAKIVELYLNEKFEKVKNGKGIACTISMQSIIGVAIYQFLSNNRIKKEE